MKSNTKTDPMVIQKEEIPSCRFPRQEVLSENSGIENRRRKLENATILGNIDHNKCKIIFEDDEGVKQVETTVWATGEENISLKHGATIPICRIRDVKVL